MNVRQTPNQAAARSAVGGAVLGPLTLWAIIGFQGHWTVPEVLPVVVYGSLCGVLGACFGYIFSTFPGPDNTDPAPGRLARYLGAISGAALCWAFTVGVAWLLTRGSTKDSHDVIYGLAFTIGLGGIIIGRYVLSELLQKLFDRRRRG